MATTSFQGIVRSYGGQDKSVTTPGVVVLSETISFDAAASAASLTPVRIGTSASAGARFHSTKRCYTNFFFSSRSIVRCFIYSRHWNNS